MLTVTPFDENDVGAVISAPGLYAISAEAYHADNLLPAPSLSSTLARTILDASPLHAKHEHPILCDEEDFDEAEDDTATTLDIGSAAHAMLLGVGAPLAVLDYKDFRTKAAKEARDEARAEGKTPIKASDHRRLQRIVRAARRQIRDHAAALPGLLGSTTLTEHAIYWREGDAWCRALLDMLHPLPSGEIAIVDYKCTDGSAAPRAVEKRAFNMGYDVQLAWYRRGVRRLLGPSCPPVRCFLMSQERKAPHAMSIVEAAPEVLDLADKMGSAAIQLWAQCLAANEWPAYPPFIATMGLPGWRENAWLEREVNDDALAGAGWKFALPLAPEPSRLDAQYLRAG